MDTHGTEDQRARGDYDHGSDHTPPVHEDHAGEPGVEATTPRGGRDSVRSGLDQPEAVQFIDQQYRLLVGSSVSFTGRSGRGRAPPGKLLV